MGNNKFNKMSNLYIYIYFFIKIVNQMNIKINNIIMILNNKLLSNNIMKMLNQNLVRQALNSFLIIINSVNLWKKKNLKKKI